MKKRWPLGPRPFPPPPVLQVFCAAVSGDRQGIRTPVPGGMLTRRGPASTASSSCPEPGPLLLVHGSPRDAGGGGRMKGARMRNRRLEIVGPADNASSFRSMIQKPQFCPDPAHEVGMEGNHLGWVCKRCHTPSLAKPKWSAADRGTRHFLILRLNL